MKITRTVKKILDNYESDCPGTKANLARILMHASGKDGLAAGRANFEDHSESTFDFEGGSCFDVRGQV